MTTVESIDDVIDANVETVSETESNNNINNNNNILKYT